jgi:hypothetical protein
LRRSKSAAKSLGRGEDVGNDALLHATEQRAGAPRAALDLVEDEQRVVVARRRAAANSGVLGIMPPSPCIGSRITAQMSSPPSSANAASAGHVVVADVREAVGCGPKPVAYLAWPPAVTVNSVAVKALSVDTTRDLATPKWSCA